MVSICRVGWNPTDDTESKEGLVEPEGVQCRLAAILASDVAGYTQLVEQDIDGTVADWQARTPAEARIIDARCVNQHRHWSFRTISNAETARLFER